MRVIIQDYAGFVVGASLMKIENAASAEAAEV